MDELYMILEQSLYIDYKLKSLMTVLEMLRKNKSNENNADIQSIISVVIDSVECITSKQTNNTAAIDGFIAKNASRLRQEVNN